MVVLLSNVTSKLHREVLPLYPDWKILTPVRLPVR
jgi:hypothetical protein